MWRLEASASTLFYCLCVQAHTGSDIVLTPGYGCSRRSVSSPISSSLPWSPALYFDDGDLSFHRMSAIAFAVYSQRCYPEDYGAVPVEHPSQIRFYSQYYHFPHGLRVTTVFQFYFLRHRKAHVRPSFRLAKNSCVRKGYLLFWGPSLPTITFHKGYLRLFRRLPGWAPDHKLIFELTYCKSSYIITFPAGEGNKITQYKPLISVYPFAGLGAYVPSPGIRINRYFAPSGRPAASPFSFISSFRSSLLSSYSFFYPRNSRTQFHSRPFYLYSRTSHIHFSSTL